jgi:hypothetical protein
MNRHPFRAGLAPRTAPGPLRHVFYAQVGDAAAVWECFGRGQLAFDPIEVAIWWQDKRNLLDAIPWQQGVWHLLAIIVECGCKE